MKKTCFYLILISSLVACGDDDVTLDATMDVSIEQDAITADATPDADLPDSDLPDAEIVRKEYGQTCAANEECVSSACVNLMSAESGCPATSFCLVEWGTTDCETVREENPDDDVEAQDIDGTSYCVHWTRLCPDAD